MKLILTRHTTTEWNIAGRIQGQTDIPLALQGEEEAERLALLLSVMGIDLIVSSDLARAHQTAEIINTALHVPLRLEPRIKECCFGKIEGLTKQEALDQFGDVLESDWIDQCHAYDFRPFGGEHRDDVLARHREVLNALAEEKPNDTILLVGHGRGMCTLLAGLGQTPDLKRGEYRVLEYSTKH